MVKTVLVRDIFETNSYFYVDEASGHGFLIDPGAEAEKLMQLIKSNGWVIEKILLTHGHFDHTGAVEQLADVLSIPYYIHQQGKKYLESTHFNLSRYCNRNVVLEYARYFSHQDTIALKSNPEFGLTVMHTPGHTEDSCVLYSPKERVAFVGDTIFSGSIGDTSYPGGNISELQRSIVDTIFRLHEDTVLFSGHSVPTTVGTEKARYL